MHFDDNSPIKVDFPTKMKVTLNVFSSIQNTFFTVNASLSLYLHVFQVISLYLSLPRFFSLSLSLLSLSLPSVPFSSRIMNTLILFPWLMSSVIMCRNFISSVCFLIYTCNKSSLSYRLPSTRFSFYLSSCPLSISLFIYLYIYHYV